MHLLSFAISPKMSGGVGGPPLLYQFLCLQLSFEDNLRVSPVSKLPMSN